MRTSLAWKNLTHDYRRLAVAVGGIGFAVMLMFQQRGFQNALFDSTVEIIRELDADLVFINTSRFALTSESRFSADLVEVAGSVEGVASVAPVYLENMRARLRTKNNRARPIRVIAFRPNRPIFVDQQKEILDQQNRLKPIGHALIDRLSKSSYGLRLTDPDAFPQTAELNGRQIMIVGTFQSGRDFAHDGNLIMNTDSFIHYFPRRSADPLATVDIGLVKIDPAIPVAIAQARLARALAGEVTVMTRQQYIDREIGFWSRNTPIGIIFSIGTVIGFVVGVIICYQILANDIAEHMAEFATLKAMGYSDRYFFGLVVGQAVYLAMLGFLPGLLFSLVLFQVNTIYTGLPMLLTIDRILLILLATLAMCIFSSLFAVRKLLAADPASLF